MSGVKLYKQILLTQLLAVFMKGIMEYIMVNSHLNISDYFCYTLFIHIHA